MRRVFVGGIFVSIATVIATLIAAAGSGPCTQTVGPSDFLSGLASASNGDVLCLTTGSYGTFEGTNKSVVIKAADNSTPSMNFDFRAGDSGFVIDGMTEMSGLISGATDIVIRNSSFTEATRIQNPATRGIVFEKDKFNWPVGPTFSGGNAKIVTDDDLTGGTLLDPALTIKNSQIKNGDLDGIHFGGGEGIIVDNNVFSNICDANIPNVETNHTDNIQWQGGTQIRISRNYIYAPNGCSTQGITSFDSNTHGLIIEENVVDIRRPWGIELYSDDGSIVRHNTLMIHPDAECDFTGITCGKINIDRKLVDPVGTGTQVYDNVTAAVTFQNGSTGTEHHNLCSVGGCAGTGSLNNVSPVFRGGSNPVFYDGYRLAPFSFGKGAASDGKDMGVAN